MFNFLKSVFKKNKRPARLKKSAPDPGANELFIYFRDWAVLRIVRRPGAPAESELTAVVPRAEFRRRIFLSGGIVSEEEIVLNSVTLADAPRHDPVAVREPSPRSKAAQTPGNRR